MIRHAEQPHWTGWNIAVTGINAKPENPGPGCAVVRCLRQAAGFRGRIIGLAYETLDAGLYLRDGCDSGHLLPYPATGAAALLERLDEIVGHDRIDALLPCLDAELPNFIAIEGELKRRGIHLMLPQRAQLRRRGKDRLPELGAAAGVAKPDVQCLGDERFFDHCGADDYICKPYSPREVVARVKAVLRRTQPAAGVAATPNVGGSVLEIDADALQARVAGKSLELTAKEFRLLQALASKPGRVFSRAQLLDAVYDDNLEVSERAIDSHLKNLRKKLALVFPDEEPIRSIYGVGFAFEP